MSDPSPGKAQTEEKAWRAKSASRAGEMNIVLLLFSSIINRRLKREPVLAL
jgi:hypothetical protein